LKNSTKALYLGFNRSYTNPTAEILLRILGSILDLQYYGPGFSSEHELSLGVEKWIKLQDHFDFIIVDTYIFEADKILTRSKPFLGDYIKFKPEDFKKYSLEYNKYFLSFVGKKILISNWDTYNIDQNTIETLITSKTFVLDPGHSLSDLIVNIKNTYGLFTSGNDNWFNFTSTYKHKIISVPHIISSSEFDFSPLNSREYFFTIIGASYPERKNAFKILPLQLKINRFLYRLKESFRYRLSSQMSYKFLINLRHNYLNLVSNSKLCYCSGGPWLYPVRKYFEIPARGTVAVGWICTGFENLGFFDGENFIIASNNREILSISSKYSINDLEAIAFAGRKLIWEKHSDWARRIQIEKSITMINTGKFKGSFWKKGEYCHY
jgi:hypothetical protein